MPNGHSEWWHDAVVYQIYPRSFCDTNGDGVGDIQGIRSRLGYLRDLGVDAIWLSPVYPSPMADFGYDVADFCGIDPLFGTLADFDELLEDTHRAGMRLLMDYVPNHTSSEHPWFTAARRSRDDPMRDRYVWRDPAADGGPPNNWRRAFSEEPAWTLDERTGQYYLHLFLPEQPDLDWQQADVRAEMCGALRFWMDRGVDGFRADVVHCIGKGADLPDAPGELAGLPACIFDHGPGTHECLRLLRQVVDGDDPGAHLLLGETAVFDRDQQISYLGRGDELHLAFNFLALHAGWNADAWRSELELAYAAHDARGAWPTWVMSNHDLPRHATRYGSEARARAAGVLLLSLRGTPFIYQGEELGLRDAQVPPERVVDPGGRDGCRAPVPWQSDDTGGWGSGGWLPSPPDVATHSVEAELADDRSMLRHYRRLLELRRSLPVLRRGALELLDAPNGVLRFRRSVSADGRGSDGVDGGPTTVEVAVNFTSDPVPGAVSPGAVLGGTCLPDGEGAFAPTDGTLGPDEACIVVPGAHTGVRGRGATTATST